jgi:hypothetical protein
MVEKGLLKGLTEEQIAKVKACKTHEELLKLSKEEGIELSDEQLEAVSGGGLCKSTPPVGPCPYCKSMNTAYRNLGPCEFDGNPYVFQCNDCLKVF